MNERASAPTEHNVTAARVSPADYARWKATGLDARAVFLRGLAAVEGAAPAAAPTAGTLAITLDPAALALAERITAAIEHAADGHGQHERRHVKTAAPDPAAALAALAAVYGPAAHITRDQVMSLLGCGEKRARSELAALVGAGMARPVPRQHPHPQTWALVPAPTAGTSPPADG